MSESAKVTSIVALSGPTCSVGRFEMSISGPLTAKVIDNVIRQLEIYKSFVAEDETAQQDEQTKSETEPSN